MNPPATVPRNPQLDALEAALESEIRRPATEAWQGQLAEICTELTKARSEAQERLLTELRKALAAYNNLEKGRATKPRLDVAAGDVAKAATRLGAHLNASVMALNRAKDCKNQDERGVIDTTTATLAEVEVATEKWIGRLTAPDSQQSAPESPEPAEANTAGEPTPIQPRNDRSFSKWIESHSDSD